MNKICFYRRGKDYYAIIENKIYRVTKELLNNIDVENNIEILMVAVCRAVKAKILSSLLNRSDNKQIYEKQILNSNGHLSFGIIMGDNLEIDAIPLEIQIKKCISKREWNQHVIGNIFKETIQNENEQQKCLTKQNFKNNKYN